MSINQIGSNWLNIIIETDIYYDLIERSNNFIDFLVNECIIIIKFKIMLIVRKYVESSKLNFEEKMW